MKASVGNCTKLKEIIEAYCLASGQEVSLEKSTLCFSAKTHEVLRDEFSSFSAKNDGSSLQVDGESFTPSNWQLVIQFIGDQDTKPQEPKNSSPELPIDGTGTQNNMHTYYKVYGFC